MIITGLVAGTSALLASSGTLLQPTNIQQINNNEVTMYSTKDTQVKISHDEDFEIIVANEKGHVVAQDDGGSFTVKIKKNTKYVLDAQTGWNDSYFKINNKNIVVKANQ